MPVVKTPYLGIWVGAGTLPALATKNCTFSWKSYLVRPRFRISANDRKGAARTQMESSMCAPQSQKLGASGRDHVARWTLKCHFGAKSWREMTRVLAGEWCAAPLASAAVERQLLLPSTRRPGLRSTSAGLPPAPQPNGSSAMSMCRPGAL